VIVAALLSLGLFMLGRYGFRTAGSSTSELPAKSIAVLPFENLSRDPDNAFFTDGVQDEILTDLARIADLKVISRTSVMQYKTGVPRNLREIAQQLGVAHVVEGSVQRLSNRVRVNAQLIDARNDAHLWAQTYDRDLADVFAIQSEIAKTIADQLQAKLSPAEKNAIEQRPTADVTAFELYSRANDLMLNTSLSADTSHKLLTAVDLLNRALERDSSFFFAQCQLAQAHDLVYMLGGDHTAARLALADAAVEAAARLRPNAGEAHRARGEHLYRGYLDYDRALAELEVARRTLPNDPRILQLFGAINRRRGNLEEGLRHFERALEVDPRNLVTLQQLAIFYQFLRRFPEEIAILDRALAINPADVTSKAARAFVFLDWKADTRPLHQAIEEIRAQQPTDLTSVADSWFLCALAERDAPAAEAALAALGDGTFGEGAIAFDAAFGKGLLARMTGDEPNARLAFTAAREQQQKIVKEQPNYGPPLCILALIDAGRGRTEQAMEEIERATELLPLDNDALNGADMVYYSAIVAAWVGNKEVACQQLAKALQRPATVTYGRLKLLPWWDPIRGDPRFEQIVASLAPQNTSPAIK
jgi:TolB-like protein/Tfp pilus assembly protein PilF